MGDIMSNTRIPTQKRSIEKRNKIIEKGFELMCLKGYFNTNTAEIAKYANVSTGIIYQYFNDKKEIFIAGVENYYNKITVPTVQLLNNDDLSKNIDLVISNILDSCVKNHDISKDSHKNLMAMTQLDEEIAAIFNNYEIDITNKVHSILKDNGYNISLEKIHILIGIVDDYCHEIVYHKHDLLDYDNMKKEVIDIIKKSII